MDFSTIGLIIIVLGWIIQLYTILVNKNRNININFLILYVIGVIFILSSDFTQGNIITGVLNIISMIIPLIIVIHLIMHK